MELPKKGAVIELRTLRSFNKHRPAPIRLFHSTVMVALLRDRSAAVA
jgi:hypothetical protein